MALPSVLTELLSQLHNQQAPRTLLPSCLPTLRLRFSLLGPSGCLTSRHHAQSPRGHQQEEGRQGEGVCPLLLEIFPRCCMRPPPLLVSHWSELSHAQATASCQGAEKGSLYSGFPLRVLLPRRETGIGRKPALSDTTLLSKT